MSTANLTFLPTTIPLPAVPSSAPYEPYRGQHTPLVIDNGATSFRFGFCDSSPNVTTNVVAKYKDRRTNKPVLLFGDAIDAESGAKGQSKTPWEGDVLLNFDAMVCFVL